MKKTMGGKEYTEEEVKEEIVKSGRGQKKMVEDERTRRREIAESHFGFSLSRLSMKSFASSVMSS